MSSIKDAYERVELKGMELVQLRGREGSRAPPVLGQHDCRRAAWCPAGGSRLILSSPARRRADRFR